MLSALALDLLHPERPFFNLLLVVAGSCITVKKAVHWLLARYVDALYLPADSRLCFWHVAMSLGMPVERRALVLCWIYAKNVSYFITWNRAGVSVILLLCYVGSWQFISAGWQKRIKELCESFQLWAIHGTTNLVYRVTVVAWIMLKSTGKVIWAITRFFSPSAPIFSYSSLPDFDPRTQIRLLRLDRRLPFFGVSGQLVSYLLAIAPPYHAISYAWSHGPRHHQYIKVNGMNMCVKSNVYDILLRCSSFLEPQLIWIDSICINQTSPSEKTVQVRRMREIHERGAHVLVCLGDGPAYLALGLIRELKSLQQRFGNVYINEHITLFVLLQKNRLAPTCTTQSITEAYATSLVQTSMVCTIRFDAITMFEAYTNSRHHTG
jgi:hypothetical protein